MANTIDQAFITQFESDVHLAYQRMGSKLRNTVRQVNGVTGSTVKFQKIGKGAANTKSRNGDVTGMEVAHTNVTARAAKNTILLARPRMHTRSRHSARQWCPMRRRTGHLLPRACR